MIDFNRYLQTLSDKISIVNRLNRQFISQQSNELIKIISGLDPHKKGYLTHRQLIKNGTDDMYKFINKKFQQRITYTVLASYLQKLQNNSSTNLLNINQNNIVLQNITSLLEIQCQIQKYIQLILNNIHKYIIPIDHKITKLIFENYCHSQKLQINPGTLFNYLTINHQYILVSEIDFGYEGNRKNYQQKLKETQKKINRLSLCLKKLDERVNQFGVEWL